MTGRVSIPELRGHLADGGSFEWSMLSDRQLATVLALVEAVEAAENVAPWRDYSADYADEGSFLQHREDFERLDRALARFDFGNETT